MASETPVVPLLGMSENGTPGAAAAMEILRAGGIALAAVEAACRVIEENLADQTSAVIAARSSPSYSVESQHGDSYQDAPVWGECGRRDG